MVTIIPIDIDHDLIRDGVQHACGERLVSAIRGLNELATQLTAGNLVGREEWEKAWDRLSATRNKIAPILEYAKAFDDSTYEETDEETPA